MLGTPSRRVLGSGSAEGVLPVVAAKPEGLEIQKLGWDGCLTHMACSLSSSSLSEVTHGMMEDNPMSGVYCKPGKWGDLLGFLKSILLSSPAPAKCMALEGLP